MLWWCCFPGPKCPTTSQSSQKRSHTLVVLRPTQELQEDRNSPYPAEIIPRAVGTCPVPAGGGKAAAGKQDWISPPAPGAPQLPVVQGWDPALPGGSLFSSGIWPQPALTPLFLAEDETSCSCGAGAEALEVCKDAWGGKNWVQVGGLGSCSQLR